MKLFTQSEDLMRRRMISVQVAECSARSVSLVAKSD
jgi:hypothetical protein